MLVACVAPGAKPDQAASLQPSITALAASPDGENVLIGSQRGVEVQSWVGERTSAFNTELAHVHDLAFSPDGRALAVAGGSPAEFGVIELWSWPGRKLIGRLEGHDDVVYGAAWVDAGRIATCSADRTVRVWDVAAGTEVANLAGHSGPVLCLAVSPDAALLCTGSTDQTIRVWDTRSWQLLRTFTNHLGPVQSLAFRPAALASTRPPAAIELASAGGDGTVRIWQPAIGRMVRIIRHTSPVFALAWIDAKTLAAGSRDGLGTIDAASGNLVHDHPTSVGWITSLGVSPDQKRLAVGTASNEVHVIASMTTDQ